MNDKDYIINGAEEATALVESIINATDWEKLYRENLGSTPDIADCLSNTSNISPEQYAESMGSLVATKDISTYTFSQGTRFKLLKRMIRRFIRVSTNHQQVFNNALLELMQNMISDMQKVGRNQSLVANYLMSKEQAQVAEIKKIKELESNNQERLDELSSRMVQRLNTIQGRLDLLKDAGVDLFADAELQSGKRSLSQAGEDGIIDYICKVLQIPLNECDYIDLGANHPCHFSNTYYFYQAGARGVLVEANPKLANELRFYRHRDIVLNRFVSSKNGQPMDFYVLNGDGLSTADYNAVQEFIKENPWLEVVDTVQVESISMNEIIAHLGHAPKILNIDVEGMEMEILKDIDFEAVRPMIIIVEMIPYSKDLYVGARNGEILEFMDKVGYAEFAFTGINSIFIDKERVGGHRT